MIRLELLPRLLTVACLSGFLATSCSAENQAGRQSRDLDRDRQLIVALNCITGAARSPQQWGAKAGDAMIRDGWNQLSLNNPTLAIDRFMGALTHSPRIAEAFWGLAVASHVAGYPDATVNDCFERTTILLPHVAGVYSDFGRALEERGKTQAAIEQFGNALRTDPNWREAHVGIARAYFTLGDQERGVAHMRAAERLPLAR